MKEYKGGIWGAGGVFVILIIFAIAWFAFASPNLAEVKQLQQDTEVAEDQNHIHQVRLTQLQAQYEKIDEFRAELALLREQIPETHELTELSRQLDSIAETEGVFIVSILPELPMLLDVEELQGEADTNEVGSDADAVDPERENETDDESDVATDELAEVATVAGPAGFTAVPISITVLGSYEDALGFVDAVQRPEKRLIFISAINTEVQEETESQGGRPATGAGDVEVVIEAYAYVQSNTSPDSLSEAETELAEGVDDSGLPASNRNPFGK